MHHRLTYCFMRIGLVLVLGVCCFLPAIGGTPPLQIHDSIPLHQAGIINNVRVPCDTSFGVLIVATHGVDLTDPDSIRFVIDDEVHQTYVRDIGDDTVRVIKINDDEDTRAAQFWAVYDRALETYMPDAYAFDATVAISVDVRDRRDNLLLAAVFNFRIESGAEHVAATKNMPQTVMLDPSDPILEGVYDTGIEVISGDLAGAKIVYTSNEPLAPRFGPVDEMAPFKADDLEAVGAPMNLQPNTIFNTPVRIFIPNPTRAELSEVGIYYYNGLQWQHACDTDGKVLEAGFGWMQAGSRIAIDDNDPALIAIDVHHFSGIQTVVFASFSSTKDDDRDDSGSNATVFVSCFIDTAGSGNISVLWMFAAVGLLLAGFVLSNSKFRMWKSE
ncbi:MAG: hypothetical protein PVF79_18770 [Desulfobacterales bacterium]